MLKKIAALTIAASFFVPEYVKAGPLDDIRKGVQILNGLDQIRKRNKRVKKQRRQNQRVYQNNGNRQNLAPSKKTTQREWAQIQARLNELGFDAGKVDGKPGGLTKNAIAAFQAANGLVSDGKIGPNTRAILFSNNARSNPGVQASGGQNFSNQPSNSTLISTGNTTASNQEAGLVGVWQGRMVCVNETFDYEIVIGPAFKRGQNGFNNTVTEHGTIFSFGQPNSSQYSVVSTKTRFVEGLVNRQNIRVLSVGKSSDKWINNPNNYRAGEFSGRFDPSKGWLSVKHEHCNILHIGKAKSPKLFANAYYHLGVEDPNAAKTQKTTVASQNALLQNVQRPGPINGKRFSDAVNNSRFASYYGSTKCKKDTHRFLFITWRENDGRYRAYMYHFYRWSGSGFHRQDNLIGEYNSTSNTFSYVRDGSQLHSIKWLGNKIIEIKDGVNPVFSINGSNCLSGKLKQYDTARTQSPVGPNLQGNFFRAQTPRRKCEALIEWLSKHETVLDSKKRSGSKNFAKMYVDELFIPVFGIPYDRLSIDHLKKNFRLIPTQRNYDCYDEAFVKDRWRSVQNIYREGFSSDRKIYIDWYVRRNRSIDEEIRKAIDSASNIYSVESIFNLADENELKEFLSEAKVREFNQQVENRKETKAKSDLNIYLADLRALPLERKIVRGQNITKNRPAFFKYLSKEEQSNFVREASKNYNSAVDEAVNPIYLEVSLLPQSLEGLKRANTIVKTGVMTKLDEKGRNIKVVQELYREIKNIEEAIANQLRAELNQHSPTLTGLQANLAWFEVFEKNFKNQLPENKARRIQLDWNAKREQLLEGSLKEFEDRVTSLEEAGAKELLDQYITEEDKNRPIALEYEFAAEVF